MLPYVDEFWIIQWAVTVVAMYLGKCACAMNEQRNYNGMTVNLFSWYCLLLACQHTDIFIFHRWHYRRTWSTSDKKRVNTKTNTLNSNVVLTWVFAKVTCNSDKFGASAHSMQNEKNLSFWNGWLICKKVQHQQFDLKKNKINKNLWIVWVINTFQLSHTHIC